MSQPLFSMGMWRALLTTLNLETVEDKEEEKSIKGMVVGGELRGWSRGTSISPHGAQGNPLVTQLMD